VSEDKPIKQESEKKGRKEKWFPERKKQGKDGERRGKDG
jgi:hypothetical protein